MASLSELHSQLLADGKITETEVEVVRNYIQQNGKLDLEDVKFLVNLVSEAKEVCAAFDDLLFPTLREVILEDGRIGRDEQFYILKLLYADGHLRPSEKQFLVELRRDLDETTPEFEELCEVALSSPEKNWDLGGDVLH